MSARDDFTGTVDAAAAFEKARALREDDYDDPEPPDWWETYIPGVDPEPKRRG